MLSQVAFHIDAALLEKIMYEKGYSRRRLSEELQVSRSTIKRILNGNSKPSYDVLMGISHVLELKATEFLSIWYPPILEKERLVDPNQELNRKNMP